MEKAAADRSYARNFINDQCIARVPPGSRALPSYQGQGSGFYTWQFYLRAALFNPDVLGIIVEHFLDCYEEPLRAGLWQLCGVESASTPLLTGIALEAHRRGYDVPVFSIRKDRKTYGLMNWLEGRIVERPAMLIDDLTSESHKTAYHAVHVLDDHGIPIVPEFYAVVFKSHNTYHWINVGRHRLLVVPMFDLNDFDLSVEEYHARSTRHAMAEEPAPANPEPAAYRPDAPFGVA